jgi:hypothetical protein
MGKNRRTLNGAERAVLEKREKWAAQLELRVLGQSFRHLLRDFLGAHRTGVPRA